MPLDSDVTRLLAHLGLAPRCNNSKWIRLFNEQLPAHGIDSVLVKLIDEEQAFTVTSPLATRKTGMLRDDAAWKKWPLTYIHWIEVAGDTRLQSYLIEKVFSFRAIGSKLRIFGYQKR